MINTVSTSRNAMLGFVVLSDNRGSRIRPIMLISRVVG